MEVLVRGKQRITIEEKDDGLHRVTYNFSNKREMLDSPQILILMRKYMDLGFKEAKIRKVKHG